MRRPTLRKRSCVKVTLTLLLRGSCYSPYLLQGTCHSPYLILAFARYLSLTLPFERYLLLTLPFTRYLLTCYSPYLVSRQVLRHLESASCLLSAPSLHVVFRLLTIARNFWSESRLSDVYYWSLFAFRRTLLVDLSANAVFASLSMDVSRDQRNNRFVKQSLCLACWGHIPCEKSHTAEYWNRHTNHSDPHYKPSKIPAHVHYFIWPNHFLNIVQRVTDSWHQLWQSHCLSDTKFMLQVTGSLEGADLHHTPWCLLANSTSHFLRLQPR